MTTRPDPSVAGHPPSLSVVVPTYRRPQLLERCLSALHGQEAPPDEVIVVCREGDGASRAAARRFGPLVRVVTVAAPGQVAALRAGAAAASGEVVAFTDDDAEPRGGWCRAVRRAFTDPGVGAAGGRDVVHHEWGVEQGATDCVGVITALGRVVGNHHLEVANRRDVHHLKGVNMAVRASCLRFPANLRGEGAEVGNDLAISLAVRAAGFRVVYDPELVVDHYPGPRFGADGRGARSRQARTDAAFNQSYVVFSLRPELRWPRLLYVTLWGDRDSGGLVRLLAARSRGETELRGLLLPLLRAHVDAWRASRRHPLELVAATATASG